MNAGTITKRPALQKVNCCCTAVDLKWFYYIEAVNNMTNFRWTIILSGLCDSKLWVII